MSEAEDKLFNEINRLAREMTSIRQLVVQVVNYIRDAESEIPEKYRRFVNAFHDVHDIRYMYHEEGMVCPDYLDREIERMHDRYKHILEEMNLDGGAFEKVRSDMTKKGGNRYDHTRLLAKPNGESNETG